MNHEKLREFAEIQAKITTALELMFQSQEKVVDMMMKECSIPGAIKSVIIHDLNKEIGVNKI